MAAPAPGIVIDRYQVEGPIGAGSMGDVVKAIDIDLKRTVAIKILSDQHRDNPELEARFVREGRAVAAISHSNVVQVFTTGTYDGRPYIAMEFLTGRDLGGFVQERGPLSSLHAARAVLDTARGLEAAANAGLIHRDVKPANLVMLDSGSVKVTDFGLAKPLDTSKEPALTALGVVVGTPDYIAPEQARGEAIDASVDVYALGGTLYYLLVGTPPFRRGNPADDKYLKVVARHLQEPAPNAQIARPETDGQLARLQLSMMSKKADKRPNYTELIAELHEIIDRLGGPRAKTAPEIMLVRSGANASSSTPYLGGRESTGAHPGPQVDAQEDPRDRLPTTVRQAMTGSETLSGDDDSTGFSDVFPRKKPSNFLMVVTVLSSLIFLAGLLLFLFGPLPEAKSNTVAVPSSDAGALVAVNPPDATQPEAPLVAPEGMVVIAASEDSPAFFIATKPVSYGDFSKMFPSKRKPTRSKHKQLASLTKVSFADAASYARTLGGRIATPSEWAIALGTKTLDVKSSKWEWLDDGTEGTQAARAVGSPGGKLASRPPREHKDVSFRLVIDP